MWDKYLAPGFTYRMEVVPSIPLLIHAVRLTPQSAQVWAKPEVGGMRVFAEDPAKSRQTLSDLIRLAGAVGGVNGDFFPWTGDPIGLMVRDGELVSGPYPNRAVFAWGKQGSAAGFVNLSVVAKNGVLGTFPVDGWNEECGPGKVVLNTPAAGFARSKGPGVHIVLRAENGDWKPGSQWEGKVEQVVRADRVAVPDEGAVLTALGPQAEKLAQLTLRDALAFETKASGLDFSRFDQAIGGGPFLVKNGKIALDWAYQGFNAAFAEKRHPRTAVGRTRTGDIWFVTMDGRQAISAGATLEETARILLRYGCTEAINLDGGGSTTLNLFGLTLNRPSGGVEREVANGVLFFGAPPQALVGEFRILAPERLAVGRPFRLKAFQLSGVQVPNAKVLWQATGAGWVDQGGTVYPTAVGTVKVTAHAGGRTSSVELPIVEK
jgi:hypothetical protein